MPEIKLSQLPLGNLPSGVEVMEIVQDGSSRRIPLSYLQELFSAPEILTLTPDVASGAEDAALTGNVLTNDNTTVGSLSVTQFSVAGVASVFSAGATATIPGVGTIVIQANGSYTFTPSANWNGSVPVVTYQATNGEIIKQSTLTITITPVNDNPVAVADVVNTQFNQPITFAPLANDTDPDGAAALSIVQINSTAAPAGTVVTLANGSITRNADNTLTFTPNDGYQGTFNFSYVMQDAGGLTATATVTLTVGSSTGENGAATTFDALYDSAFQLTAANGTIYPRQVVTNPIGKSTNLADPKWTDPAFGTKVFVTAAVTDFSDSENPTFIRNAYAKQQYYNADSTRVALLASNGWWHIYDTATFQHVFVPGSPASGRLQITGGDNNDLTWDPVDPNILYYASAQKGGLSFRKMDISTGQTSEAWTFADKLPPGFENATKFTTGGEGRCSNDGKRWLLMATTSAEQLIGFVAYDRDLDEIVDYALCTNKPDWVGMFPSGENCVIAWSKGTSGLTMEAAQLRDMATADGTRAYPWGGLRGAVWQQMDNVGQHGDVCTDAEGYDAWVAVSHSPYMDVGGTHGDPDGGVYYRRVADGIPRVFNNFRAYWPGGTAAMHFSGCAFNRRGWIVASYNSSNDPVTADRDGCTVIMELVPENQRVFLIVHHRSFSSSYFMVPLAVPNRDLTQILFCTDYQGSVTTGRSHMIGLPSWALPTAGAASPTVNTTPKLSGAYNVGGVLHREHGTYGGDPAPTVTGTWQSSSDEGDTWTDVAGQSAADYTVALSEGTWLSWRDRVVNSGGLLFTRSPIVVVGPLAAPTNQTAPTAQNGTAGQAMDAAAGVWLGNPIVDVARVWQRDISGTWTDSAFTTVDAALDTAGSWRLKETGSNTQGTLTVYSNTVTVAAAAIFPTPSITYPMSGASRTLEADNPAWEGASTDYVVSSAGIEPNGGWNSDLTRLELGGGNNQGLEVTLDVNTGLSSRGDCYLNFAIHNDDGQGGYRVNVTNSEVRLFKNGDQVIQGGTAHNVNTATTALKLTLTSFEGMVTINVNGVDVLTYDDSAEPLQGGYIAQGSYASGTPARTRITSLKYSAAQ